MTKQELISRLLTPERFLSIRTAMNGFSDNEIQEAIYTAFDLINGVCTGLPYQVWKHMEPAYREPPVPIDETSPLFRNEYEIDQLLAGLVAQTHYTLNMGNDFTEGSSSFASGGLSATKQRPQDSNVLEPTLLIYLQNARVYMLQDYSGNTPKSNYNACDELAKYATYEEGDKRWVKKFQENSTPGHVAVIDTNKMVSFAAPDTITFKSYEADKVKDRDGVYKELKDITDLAFYEPTGGALKRDDIQDLYDSNKHYNPNWEYRKGDIVMNYNANSGYIDLWRSTSHNNIAHDPYLDNPNFAWWTPLKDKDIDAKRIWDPVDGVYKLINQFDARYFGGLNRQEIYDAIHASGTVWDANITYRKGFVVIHVDNNALNWYVSTQDNNVGHNPAIDIPWWDKLPLPAIDVTAVIDQLRPYITDTVNKAVADAIHKASTDLTTDFSGSIYTFDDQRAFDQFIASNPTLQANMFEDVDITAGNYTKQEMDALLDLKANKGDSYTKPEMHALLDQKANVFAVYTKQEANALFADRNYSYSKAESDAKYLNTTTANNTFATKTQLNNYYTKTESDGRYLRIGQTPLIETKQINITVSSWIEAANKCWLYWITGSIPNPQRVISITVNGEHYNQSKINQYGVEILTSTSWNRNQVLNATFTYVKERL